MITTWSEIPACLLSLWLETEQLGLLREVCSAVSVHELVRA